ncbi:MAG: hypothetical protein L3K09_01580, partial [Thermoplasmata archaeon]|nr:hypothetical protein [Thermoplasmata archaeon]
TGCEVATYTFVMASWGTPATFPCSTTGASGSVSSGDAWHLTDGSSFVGQGYELAIHGVGSYSGTIPESFP